MSNCGCNIVHRGTAQLSGLATSTSEWNGAEKGRDTVQLMKTDDLNSRHNYFPIKSI